jgi:hypothetical protein
MPPRHSKKGRTAPRPPGAERQSAEQKTAQLRLEKFSLKARDSRLAIVVIRHSVIQDICAGSRLGAPREETYGSSNKQSGA